MANPIVQDIVVFGKALVSGTLYVWDIGWTSVTSAGTRIPERKILGAPTGLNAAQVKAAVAATAIASDAAEKAPPAPPAVPFPGTYDATSGTQITDPNDPRLPPGTTP